MKKLTSSVLAIVLSSSFVLLQAQEKEPTKTQDIEGVVVTALGIKREAKSLGYATTSIKADDVSKSPSSNFTANLSGKVAGLSIKQSGNVGGSVDVTLRGYRSMTGNNQPLFVVDGTPMLNVVNSIASSALNVDTGNTISDINADDIAEINVLKGAAATALYGARAANGAIIITTKRGRKSNRVGVDFNTSVSVSAINKETFIKYQKTYGQGYGYNYGPNNDALFDDYNGQPMAPMYEDASYGAAFDPNLMVWQYTSFIPGARDFGKASPWVAAEHDPSFIFQKAVTYNNSVSFTKGNDVSSFRLSFQNVNGNDILPNTSLNKNSVTGNASYKLTDRITANIFATYVSQNTIGKNPTGYHGIAGNFRQWWATNVDLMDQRDLYMMSGKNYSWNIQEPDKIAPLYWDNPYFRLYENYITDKRDRFAGNFNVSYDITDKFNVLARMSHDGFTYFIDERRAVGSLPDAMSIGPATGNQPSGYATVNQRRSEDNYDLIGTYKDKFFDNALSFIGLIGANMNVQKFGSNGQGTQGGLYIPGIYTVTNSATTPNLPQVIDTTKKIYGVFGQASFGIKDTYFLEGTVRNDTSSALSMGNRNYWYYSGSASIVLTGIQAIKDLGFISFAKLRGSYAEVGNDVGADNLRNKYAVATPFGTPSYAFNTTAKNPDLRPERTKATEAGINLQFLKNRVGVDFAWFRNDTHDQILSLPVSYGTGVAFKIQNVGNMRSQGFEVALNLVPIKSTNFTWELDANWSNPRSKVTALASGVENITLGSFQGGITVNAALGQDFGAIKGTDYVYDPNGNPIVAASGSSAGKYLKTNTNAVIGNMQADWMGSMTNRLKYKEWALSFQIDWKQGGDIFSLDQYYGQNTGLYPESVYINDLGNPVRNTLANGGGLILPGVKSDGHGGFVQNDIRLDASSTGAMGYQAYPAKQFVYDATFIKLREVALTYTIPNRFLDTTFLKGAALSLVGNNLWIIKKNLPYADPESGLSAGNVQGYQTSVLPTTRTISFDIKLNF